jgi:hypothetical protein
MLMNLACPPNDLKMKIIRLHLILATFVCLSASGQQSFYNYDASGNVVSISLAGSAPVALIAPPQSQLLVTNAPVTFSVVASGSGISYQWLSNGVAMIGATGDSIVLTNLSGPHLASYSVIVSNASGAVTSAPAAVWPDSNGSGMPDWWQLQYFGNLNQLPTGDFDNDGVENLDEYLEGTNPNNASSYDPRLFIQSLHGWVFASPSQPYYTMGQIVNLTAVPESGQTFVGWTGDFTGSKSAISVVMNSHKTFTANFGLPLPVALDNRAIVWTTGGDASWFGQTEISADGLGAAQSGSIVGASAYTTEGTTWLQGVTNLTTPMQLGFWWSVSSEPLDAVVFSIDGLTQASLSGLGGGWLYFQTNLPAGLHTLLWTYSKPECDCTDGTGSVFMNTPWLDAAWVDAVTLTPATTALGSPLLAITLSNPTTAIISWPAPLTGFVLQQNTSLATTNWVNETNPVTLSSGQNQVTVAPTNSDLFFRLVHH